jgi:peptide/nickel transport system permease protein
MTLTAPETTSPESGGKAVPAGPGARPLQSWPLAQWSKRTGLPRHWFRPNKVLLALAVLFILLMAAWAAFPSLFASGSPTAVNATSALTGPSASFPLGADQYGRSIYTELVYGARSALEIGFFCTLLGGGIGSAIGIFSGYFGGKVDMVVMRGVDVLMAVPPLFMALIFIAALAPTQTNEIIAVSVATAPIFARVLRGRALEVRSRLYVDALTVVGVRRRRILWRHVIPNSAAPAMVLGSINVGTAIVTAASLNFLGLGPSDNTSWGTLISSGEGYINKEWWISIFPGVLITLLVISTHTVGDWVRERLEPSSR